jgi:hypothetical protein
LYLAEAEAGHFAMEKTFLLDVYHSPVGDYPQIEIVVSPLYEKCYPEYHEPK